MIPIDNQAGKPMLPASDENWFNEKTEEIAPWPKLDKCALVGFAGEFVREVTNSSEADPAAVLFTFLAFCGAVIGGETYFPVGATRHPCRFNIMVVGATGRGRKGTSASPVHELANKLPGELAIRVSPGPLSSGEGLIYAVRDESDKKDEDGNPIDSGVADKRLLIIDEELRRALQSFSREGSTLATTIRAAYDRGDLDPLTKNNRIKATGAHISIVSHITSEELTKHFHEIEIFAGTMNRFTIACGRRSKMVPRPFPINEDWLIDFAQRLATRIRTVQNLGAIEFSDEAWNVWEKLYPEISKDHPGLIGAITCRAEAQVIRYALLYALLNPNKELARQMIDVSALDSALAVVQYSFDSAAYLYGTTMNIEKSDNSAQLVLNALKNAAGGLSTSEISLKVFHNHMQSNELSPLLKRLQDAGRITKTTTGGGYGMGRPKTIWQLTAGFTN